MSPGPRRDLTPFVVVLVIGAVALFLLVGGLVYVGRASGPYHRTIDQSFGSEARLVVQQSNSVGAQFRTLVDQMTGYHRMHLAQALDSVVEGSRSVASEASLLAVPAPEGHVGADFADAMTSRAVALERLRTTIDGLLRLTAGDSGSPYPPPALSSATAVSRVVAVGQLLVAADSTYASARKTFMGVPGGSRLPQSVWVPTPVVWETGAIQTTVDHLTSAPSLAPFKDVHLVSVTLAPSVLPPAPGVTGQPQAPPLGAGISEVPPTCTLSVTAVVRNDGTIVAEKVPVEAAVQPVGGGAPFPVRKEVTLAPAGSSAVTLPDLPVAPGTTYNLAVTVIQPVGQSRPNGHEGATIAVAPFGSTKGKARCARVPTAAP